MRTVNHIILLAIFTVGSFAYAYGQAKELRQANADFNDLQYNKAATGYLEALHEDPCCAFALRAASNRRICSCTKVLMRRRLNCSAR